MNAPLKIKVCGMKEPDNIREIAAMEPDYMGFIFYRKSSRYVPDSSADVIRNINGPEKIGVFVNEQVETILSKAEKFGLKIIQLHGSESPEDAAKLREEGLKVIKVFSVSGEYDFSETNPYQQVADYFLFDTKTAGYGGSGRKYDWTIFKNYDNRKPVFLSGGIGPDDVNDILSLEELNIHAVDINSCFEKSAGHKDPALVKSFISELRTETEKR